MKKLKFKGDEKTKKPLIKLKKQEDIKAPLKSILPAVEGWSKAVLIDHIIGPILLLNASFSIISDESNSLTTIPITYADDYLPESVNQVILCHRVPTGENHFAFKNAFGKYLACDSKNVYFSNEAVGPKEDWIVSVVNEQFFIKSALNNSFLAVSESVSCSDSTPSEAYKLNIICQNANKIAEIKQIKKEEIESSVREIFEDKQDTLLSSGYRKRVTYNDQVKFGMAQKRGRIHEEMLIEREKVKSDKFCK